MQKSLITSLPTGRQGLGTDYTDEKCIENNKENLFNQFFKICVIKREYSSFSKLSLRKEVMEGKEGEGL